MGFRTCQNLILKPEESAGLCELGGECKHGGSHFECEKYVPHADNQMLLKELWKCENCKGEGEIENPLSEACNSWTEEDIEKSGFIPGDCKNCYQKESCQEGEIIKCVLCDGTGKCNPDWEKVKCLLRSDPFYFFADEMRRVFFEAMEKNSEKTPTPWDDLKPLDLIRGKFAEFDEFLGSMGFPESEVFKKRIESALVWVEVKKEEQRFLELGESSRKELLDESNYNLFLWLQSKNAEAEK